LAVERGPSSIAHPCRPSLLASQAAIYSTARRILLKGRVSVCALLRAQISDHRAVSFRPNTLQYFVDSSIRNVDRAKLEEASTHKSTKTHAGNVFVTRDLDLLTSK